MPNTPYVGTPFPVPGATGQLLNDTAPKPGGAPQFEVPADDSTPNAATLFVGQYHTAADYAAYLMKSVQWRPPVTPAVLLSHNGFTDVQRTGAGTGTIIVKSQNPLGPTGAAYLPVARISTAGAAGGTGQFQWSLDGGVTYVAAVAIPAGDYTEPTSGIVFTAAGTFALNDTYAWQPVDTPIGRFADAAGNAIEGIDHNGFVMDRCSTLHQEWRRVGVISGAGTTALTGEAASWDAVITGTAQVNGTQAPTAAYPGNMVQLQAGGNTDRVFIETANTIIDRGVNQFLKSTFCWEMSMASVGAATNVDYYAALTTATDMNGVANAAWVGFKKPGNQTYWMVNIPATGPQQITGFDPAAGTIQRFRMELHGTNGIYGSLHVRYYINDQCVLIASTAALNTPLRFLFGLHASLGAPAPAAQTMNFGPPRGKWGLFQNSIL